MAAMRKTAPVAGAPVLDATIVCGRRPGGAGTRQPLVVEDSTYLTEGLPDGRARPLHTHAGLFHATGSVARDAPADVRRPSA